MAHRALPVLFLGAALLAPAGCALIAGLEEGELAPEGTGGAGPGAGPGGGMVGGSTSGPTGAGGAASSSGVLAGILNRTVISASGSELRVAHGPVPWLGNRGVPVADIAQLYCEEHRSEGKNGATFSYRLSAVGRDGRKLALVKGLPERDQALYLEQAFEDALGIQDDPVGGEMAA